MSKVAAEKVQTIQTKSGQISTDTQVIEFGNQKRLGKIGKGEYDTILILSDGRKRTAREIAKEMNIEITNVTRNINNLKKRRIVPTPTKTTCKTMLTTVSNYSLTQELLNIKTASTLRFCNEVERLLKLPIYNFQQMIFDELKKQKILCRKTTDKTVLALFQGKKVEYLTKELSALKVAEIEADGIEVVEVLDIDDFTALFAEKL